MNVGVSLSNGVRRVRASARRDGAEASGLASLLELSFVNAAGDALITVALAGSLFLSVSPTEARSKVALYLLITMAPFAVLAPIIGPMLDRFPHGRRIALAAVCLGRAMLAWMMASVLSSTLQVYPLALGLLVLSKAFGVARSAAVPRVTPPEMTLVRVNSRLSLVNVASGTLLAPLGLAIAKVPYIGYPWVLRFAAGVFILAAVAAFRLPQHVDSAEGERRVRDLPAAVAAVGPLSSRASMGGRVARALGSLPVAVRTAAVLRGLVGFLTFYLAFLLRSSGGTNLWLGGLAIAAGVGSGLGVFIGGQLSRRKPEALLMISLLTSAGGCIGAALNFTNVTSLLAVLLATMAGSMSKLGLDAVIQRDIPEDTRTSAFARSETALQLAWVAGSALGLLSIGGTLGFSLASTVLMVALFIEVVTLRRTRVSRLAARAAARRAPRPAPAYAGDVPAAAAVPYAEIAEVPTIPKAGTGWRRARARAAAAGNDVAPRGAVAGDDGAVRDGGVFRDSGMVRDGAAVPAGPGLDGDTSERVAGDPYDEAPTLVDPDGPTQPREADPAARRWRRAPRA